MREDVVKHLEMIQGVISRMGSNSFALKGWSVGIVATLFVLSANNSNRAFALIAFLPAMVFWVLDAYYLWQERLFRALYGDVQLSIDSPNRSVIPFSFETGKYLASVPAWWQTMFAPTVLGVHGVIVASIILVLAIFCL